MTDGKQVHVDVVHTSPVKKTIRVRVDAGRVDEAFRGALGRLRKRVRIGGFRPGKVPEEIIRKRFGDALRAEALDSILPETLREVLDSERLREIGDPKISDVSFEEGSPFSFSAEVDVHPVVGEIDVEGLRVERRRRKLTEALVEKGLHAVALKHSTWGAVERAAGNGDMVEFEIADVTPGEGKKESQQHSAVLGIGVLPTEVEVRLTGKSGGEEFDVVLAHPEDHPDGRLAGRRMTYRVKVETVREQKVPPVDEDLAKAEGLSSLDELRAKVRGDLERRLDADAESRLRTDLRDALVRKNPLPTPEPVFEEFMGRALEDWRREVGERGEEAENQAREQIRPIAERQIAFAYLSREIIEREGIKVEVEDVKKRLEAFAGANGMTVEQAQRWLEERRRVRDLRESIEEDKLFEWLKQRATIVEVDDD